MTKFDKNVSKLIAFAQESENNKKQALNALAFALAAINSEKKLSDEDLKKVSGGMEVEIPEDYSATTD